MSSNYQENNFSQGCFHCYSWVASWSWQSWPERCHTPLTAMAIFTMTAMHNSFHLTRNPACSSFLPFTCCILNWSGGFNNFTHKGSGGNEKLPPLRFPTVGIVSIIRRTTTQLPPTNIITMVLRLPHLQHRFNESPQSNERAAIRRGRPRAFRQGFI